MLKINSILPFPMDGDYPLIMNNEKLELVNNEIPPMLFLKSIFETRTEFRTSLKFVEISLSLRMKNLAFNSIIDEDRRHEM